MPRSSESIAALGCALAKAQAELINPEKSLTANIRTGRAGEGEEQTFRYAPLSSGLEIVRKTLGQQQIATVQTTAIDQPAGLLNLTTMLVHSSGEWIASDWPVCSIADLSSPRRMGAALTYARRYALFTMVGIAGEDDLDAPDLQDETPPLSPRPGPANEGGNGYASPNGLILPAKSHAGRSGSRFGGSGKREARSEARPNVSLTPDQSAAVRDRLLAEITGISNAEQAAAWASGALSAKNHLTVADASRVEDAFERLLAATDGAVHSRTGCAIALRSEQKMSEEGGATTTESANATGASADTPARTTASSDDQSSGIDKSVLALPEPKRHRNKEHLRFVAQQACLICGRKPSDPHHLRFTQPRALGRKVSDEFAVPLCRSHHRALHRVGNEVGWWKAAGIDPLKVARRLWKRSRLTDGHDRPPVGLAAADRPEIIAARSGDVGQSLSEPPIASRAGDG
jgi:ERF superfamily